MAADHHEEQSTESSFFRRVSDRSCVCTKGLMFLLLWNTGIHACGYFLAFIFFLGLSMGSGKEGTSSSSSLQLDNVLLIVSAAQCTSYLSYPIAGLVGEVCWSKYNVMITGTVLSFFGLIIAMPFLVTATFHDCTDKNCAIDLAAYAIIFAIVGVFLYQFGLGLFEANAIQFGVDQLQFSSNERLSVFINWYFWHVYIAKLINIGISAAIHFSHFQVMGKVMFMAPVFLICILLVPFLFYWRFFSEALITTESTSTNPVGHIYRVLKFVVKHNQPLCRSALTYGEIPSRMDYAKQRFGGTFTTDEVEDVKAFCRVLLVLLTLFGMALQSDSNGFFSFFCMQYFVIIFGIPLHMLIIRPFCMRKTSSRKTILPKIHLGLLLVVGYNLLMLIDNFEFWNPFEPLASLLFGCSYILVFLSTLEFILAQAPRKHARAAHWYMVLLSVVVSGFLLCGFVRHIV